MRYRFQDYELDEERHELWRAGVVVPLEPKVWQVLCYLLQQRERVVSKTELFEACWPDTFVTEAALTRCLTKLRRALQPERGGPRLVQTVHGQGYRFVAEVTTLAQALATDASSPAPLAEVMTHAPPLASPSVSPLRSAAPDATPPALQSQLPLASDAPAAPERRQLTVLHCSLSDIMPLTSQLDPEDLHVVLQRLHTTCTEVIERFDGQVVQYLYDGMMGYFGYPQAHEDDARRAIHAALALRESIPLQLTGLVRSPLSMRVGIHTGRVVVGGKDGGTGRPVLAVGGTPTVAAALQSLADPNTVVISAATARLSEGYFLWEQQGEYMLPGALEPIVVYRVQQASGAQSRLSAVAPRGLTPFVGRETELRVLMDRWAQVQEGLGQVIVLSGEAGIGKSRLVQVLKTRLRDSPYTLLECQCVPYYQHTAWYPLTALLPDVLQWTVNESPESKVAKLHETVAAYDLRVEDAVPLLASLLALPLPPEHYAPLTLSPQAQRQKIMEILIALISHKAAYAPTLFHLEDVHWADPSTVEWLEMLLEQVPALRLMLLLTCRPAFEPPWGLRSYVTPVVLNRFLRQQVEEMVAHVTGGKRFPDEIMRHVVEKTDGVPFVR